MKRKLMAAFVAVMMVLALSACGSKGNEGNSAGNGADDGSITIKVFSNQTDRNNGQGLIEQMLFDSYMAENQNVKIEVEALEDEDYKTKFKAYASGSSMPDLVNIWGQPSFLDEVVAAGTLAELSQDDYTDYGFIEGSLDGFTIDGKLYGLPRNTDIMGFYYNKALFEENGWDVPETYDDLIALADKITSAGYIACSMDGSDKWPINIYIQDLMVNINGDCKAMVQEAVNSGDYSDPSFTQAVELLQEAVEAGLFQTGFETADYGTSMNLFANGEAAMYYMGSWEMSMATNEDVIESVRENIGVFMMPEVSGGRGASTDIAAWNGGGYAVTESSAVKEEAVKLLNYMMEPDNWSKLAWENGVCMSAQDYTAYLTGEETEPQLAFTDYLIKSTSITGVTFNDLGTSEYKTVSEDGAQAVSIGSLSIEDFYAQLSALVQ